MISIPPSLLAATQKVGGGGFVEGPTSAPWLHPSLLYLNPPDGILSTFYTEYASRENTTFHIEYNASKDQIESTYVVIVLKLKLISR